MPFNSDAVILICIRDGLSVFVDAVCAHVDVHNDHISNSSGPDGVLVRNRFVIKGIARRIDSRKRDVPSSSIPALGEGGAVLVRCRDGFSAFIDATYVSVEMARETCRGGDSIVVSEQTRFTIRGEARRVESKGPGGAWQAITL